MSYILDALKKSEREHQRHSLPGLHDEFDPEPVGQQRRPYWQYAVVAALLLNACLLVWWLKPWRAAHSGDAGQAQSRPPAQVAREPGARPAPSASPAGEQGARRVHRPPPQDPAAAAGRLPQKPPAPPGEAKEGGDAASRTQPVHVAGSREPGTPAAPPLPGAAAPPPPHPPQSPRAGEPASSVPPQAAAPRQQAALSAREDEAASGRQSGQAPPAVTKEPGSTDRAKSRADTPKAETAKTEKGKQASAAAAQDGRKKPVSAGPQALTGSRELASDLKALTAARGNAASSRQVARYHDLPAPVRNALPAISVSMLLYSRMPDDRRITINGTRMREGQEVAAGLKLEEITSDGAVFNYNGQRFYKGVLGD